MRSNYQCKKCLELWDVNDLQRHYSVCYGEDVSPEEIRDGFRRLEQSKLKRLEKLNDIR